MPQAKPLPKNDERGYKNHCLIVSSNMLRKMFIERCIQMNLSPYDVAYFGCGIKKRIVKEYWLNTLDPRFSKSFTQEHVIKMLEYVGIDIKITSIVKPFDGDFVQSNIENIKKRKIELNSRFSYG